MNDLICNAGAAIAAEEHLWNEELARLRAERSADRFWRAAFALLAALLALLAVVFAAMVRNSRRGERDLMNALCPSGTAARVVEDVHREPLVSACDRLADAIGL